ncbi:MAG: hypothetical protein JNM00_10305 [Flavobacteriales bacterium]|nr:hypothetical protein [Flavobacteriales bacterium]
MEFPQYRKLANGRSWYRIDDPGHMTEWVVMGKYVMKHEVEAKILPERVLIADVIENADYRWEILTEAEFREFLDWSDTHLIPR